MSLHDPSVLRYNISVSDYLLTWNLMKIKDKASAVDNLSLHAGDFAEESPDVSQVSHCDMDASYVVGFLSRCGSCVPTKDLEVDWTPICEGASMTGVHQD